MGQSEELRTSLFTEPGPRNTDATLEAAAERAASLGIEQMVVATSSGSTALEATRKFTGRVIAVTLSAGHWERYSPPDPEIIEQCRERGVEVLTGTHTLLGGIDGALRSIGGVAAAEIIARTFYMIGQGAKVAVECALMAADAGMLEMDHEAITIAGTGGGADTALVVTPAFSNTAFDLRIHEFIAMPR
ncbi:MAG: pyruvate kinase alpha/beta domain-containing protein [Armatimonadota bacterium]